ncbi:MAG: hypothetical protein AAF761_03160 [Pseudomonadota bacterium]
MKLFSTLIIGATLAAGTAMADARYTAETTGFDRADTAVLGFVGDNERYDAVIGQGTSSDARTGERRSINPNIAATRSASQGHVDYLVEQDRLKDIYR